MAKMKSVHRTVEQWGCSNTVGEYINRGNHFEKLMELNTHTHNDGAVRPLDVHWTEVWAHVQHKSCTRMLVAAIANSLKPKAQNAHRQ